MKYPISVLQDDLKRLKEIANSYSKIAQVDYPEKWKRIQKSIKDLEASIEILKNI